MDATGSALAASLRRDKATMGMWFTHHRHLCCKRIPLADRLQRLYATAGAAFFARGRGALSTELRRRCMVLEGTWLRAMLPYSGARSGAWHSVAMAQATTWRLRSDVSPSKRLDCPKNIQPDLEEVRVGGCSSSTR